MKIFFHIGTFLCIAMLTSIAVPSFAESAPVYDADSVEQQFNGDDQNQDLPPPPAPSEQEGAYVPSQPISSSLTAQPTFPAERLSTDQRIARLEQQINNLQNNDASVRLSALQAEVQALRGQVEQLMHDLQQAQSQQKSMYADLDKRLSEQRPSAQANVHAAAPQVPALSDTDLGQTEASQVERPPTSSKHRRKDKSLAAKASADTAETDEGASSDQPNVAEEQQIYQTAYNFIKAKKYNEAVLALQGMVKKYPYGQFASNAHYWLGELYGLMGKTDKALIEFNSVVKTYPHSPRVSDAQLKVGLIYASQLKWADAKSAFKKVINRYPGTSSARLAHEQLKQIRQAGH